LSESPYIWRPQTGPQLKAIEAGACVDELFFGGARGGSKTDFLLGDFAADLDQGAEWHGVLFRRSYPELDEIVRRTLELYPQLGGEYKVGVHEWHFANGARLSLRHLDTDADVTHYQGHSYSWIAFDELPNWPTAYAYNAMKATLRGSARFKRIRATGNPGGVGHLWVREYFVDTTNGGDDLYTDPTTGMSRCYVPSRVTDNKILLKNDPNYIKRLHGVGDPALVAAWLDGDWDAIVGGYFAHLRKDECEVDPFDIPPEWPIFMSMDYGETNPAWCGILAVDYDDNIYVVDEYYRSETGGADHARGIRNMYDSCPFIVGHPRPRAFLAPSDMWIKRAPGEASLAWSPADSFRDAGFYLTRCNMDRINGWRAINDLLFDKRLRFFRGRTNRVLASLLSVQRDNNNPEDVAKGGDDHAADGLRYGINHVYKPRRAPKEVGEGQAILDLLNALDKPKSRYA